MKLRAKASIAVTVLAVAVAGLLATRLGLVGAVSGKKLLASGHFHQVAHKGTGVAAIYQLPDKKLVLNLTEFQTGAGHDLQVYLIAAEDAFDNEAVESSERILVGELKQTEGDQSYTLPDDLEIARYRAVTIWSRKYRVNFTTAPLALR